MLILAFESSAKAASAALMRDGRLIGEYFLNTAQTHSRTLTVLAQTMLETCELTVSDVDAVAVAAGPGSFTGVRIGVAAAKGFAWGRELPLYGVSTLEAMVRGTAMGDGFYCACMDARRQQVYNALFSVRGGEVKRLCDDRAIGLDALGEELKTVEAPIFVVGDGAELCYNTLAGEISTLRLLPEQHRQQRASGVALAAFERLGRGEEGSGLELKPNYIRASQAEQNREKKIFKDKGD